MHNGDRIRVVCLDPHELMLAGLQLRLEREHALRVVGAISDPSRLNETTERCRPDVVVTEIDFEGADVFALISRLQRQ